MRIGIESKRTTRRARLLRGSALAVLLSSLAMHGSLALAQDECGSATNGVVTCPPSGNPYPDGITYDSADTDLNVVLAPNTMVAPDSGNVGVTISGDIAAIGVTVNGGASVATTGDYATGIAAATGSGAIAITNDGSITTTGNHATGIDAYSAGGPVTVVNTGTITTSGAEGSSGISAVSYGADVVVRSTGTVAVSSAAARGIYAASLGSVTIESNSITLDADNTEHPRAALFAVAYGAVDVKSGSIVTTGYNSVGLDYQTIYGSANIVSDSIETHGNSAFGIFGEQFVGGASVVQSGSVTTFGDDAVGISISAPYADGTITIISDNVVTHGARATGISTRYIDNGALDTGGTGVKITSGRVVTSGADADGIVADTATGAAIVTSAGVSAIGARSHGIVANSSGGTVAVTSGDVTTGGGDAIVLSSTDGATFTSTGTLDAGGGVAVRASGAGATIVNSGTMRGTLALTENGDSFSNSGTFATAGDSDFGAGTDSFANSGVFLVRPGTAAAGAVSLTGLETFTNSGLIDFRNGHPGDVLNTSSSFTGTGASTLDIDVAFGTAGTASLADRLNAAGAITGTTAVTVTPVGANGAILNSGTVFATGGANSSASAFTVAPGSENSGFIRYSIAYRAADNSYSLIGGPGDSVFRALKINEGAGQLWFRSADAWSARMSDLRDARFTGGGPAGGRFWFQAYGQTDRRDAAQTVTAFGQSRAVDISYKQDAFGGQIGLDFGTRSDGVVFGVTGGYVSSDLTFPNSADRAHFDSANVGVYASYAAHGFFVNALGKYDYDWIRATSTLAGYRTRFHGMSYGAQAEMGYRFGAARFYAEPVASIAYIRTDLDDLRAPGATIDFAKLDGLRGKAGLRVGGSVGLSGGATALIYAQGNYVHEFKGEHGLAFTSGGAALAYRNRPLGDYGEGRLGFSVTTPGGVTGFIEGIGDLGGDYKGGGGRVGLRIKF